MPIVAIGVMRLDVRSQVVRFQSHTAKALDEALGSSDIVLYLYNFPALTGIRFSVDLIKRMATEMPSRVGGIKDSSADLPYCREIAVALPDFKVFPSSETALGTAKDDGFAGCISASVNITCPWAGKLWHHPDTQDRDDLIQKLTDLRSEISAVPLVPSVKHLVGLREGRPGWDIPMPPLLPLSGAEKEQLESTAKTVGYR